MVPDVSTPLYSVKSISDERDLSVFLMQVCLCPVLRIVNLGFVVGFRQPNNMTRLMLKLKRISLVPIHLCIFLSCKRKWNDLQFTISEHLVMTEGLQRKKTENGPTVLAGNLMPLTCVVDWWMACLQIGDAHNKVSVVRILRWFHYDGWIQHSCPIDFDYRWNATIKLTEVRVHISNDSAHPKWRRLLIFAERCTKWV